MSKESRHKRYLKSKIAKAERIIKLFYDKNDTESSVADCIADLMHICHRDGLQFYHIQQVGLKHFHAELECDDTLEHSL